MIIHRALVREVLHTSGAVTVVILSIFLVVRALGFLRAAAQGDIPVDGVLILVGLKVVGYLDVILPLMLYIAMLMVLARWSRDNEMTVLAACGVGLTNLLKPLLLLVLVVGGIVALFSLYLTPLAVRMGFQIEDDYRNRSEVSGVIPGVFMETRTGKGVYFVEHFDRDNDRYENLFIYKSSFGREGVVVAKYGFKRLDELTGDQFLVLKNGTRYEGNPGAPDYRIVDFETYALRIPPHTHSTTSVPFRGQPTLEVMASDLPRLKSEWQWRLSKVVVVPVLGLFALAFSLVNPRQSRLPSLFLAFFAYFLYTNTLGFGVALVNRGRMDPALGLWTIHAVFLALAILAFYRRSRNLPLFPTWRFRRLARTSR